MASFTNRIGCSAGQGETVENSPLIGKEILLVPDCSARKCRHFAIGQVLSLSMQGLNRQHCTRGLSWWRCTGSQIALRRVANIVEPFTECSGMRQHAPHDRPQVRDQS
jgi:hypothetical protein